MDINIMGMQNLNPVNNPFSSQGPLGAGALSSQLQGLNSGGGDGAFADIMRRVQNTQLSNAGDLPPAPLPHVPPIVQNMELFELSMELETFLMKNLINGMRNTIQRSNLIDTGFAGEIYEDMLFNEYARIFARNANLGFAEMVYRDLTGNRITR